MLTSQRASERRQSSLVGDPQSPPIRRPGPKPVGREHLAGVLAGVVAIEFLVVAVTAYLASLAYNQIVLMRSPPADQYVSAALFIAAVITLASLSFRHYAALQTLTRSRFVWRGVRVVGLTFALFLSAMFVLKVSDIYSRGTFIVQLVTIAAAIAVYRAVALTLVRSGIARGYLGASRLVLVGDQIAYTSISKHLTEQGITTVGSFHFPVRRSGRRNGADDEIDLKEVRRLIAECRLLRPDDILIAPAEVHLGKAMQVAALLSELPVSIHLLPFTTADFLPTARVSELGAQVTIQLVSRPLSILDRAIKRIFDATVAFLGLLLLSPLLLVIAAAVKLESRGPIFFRQTRHGFNNEPIRVFKFRSMSVTEDGEAFKQAKKADPRITRVGQILRRTNIDELPQLFNVLIGEMSLVGPRPHPIALNEQYRHSIGPFMRRHNIKPGITGWAQVNGYRGETDTLEKMQSRLEYDLYYIDNWSFLFDMKIIALTLFSPKAFMNAY